MFTGPSGSPTRFYAHAGGNPVGLVFPGPAGADDPTVSALGETLGARDNVTVLCVTDDSVAERFITAQESPAVAVLDPNLRIVEIVADKNPAERAAELLAAAGHTTSAVSVRDQAPVLFVPRVLSADQCDRLIQLVEQAGDTETGVERSVAGTRGEFLDGDYKRRRDHTVSDPELLRELSTSIGRRLMPELRKAFAFRATRFEGFKIACYDAAAGGFFHAHRDNLSSTTAHRVFALTLNLNEAYEGGQLRFPEYGNQLYRPDAGTALVFSCAHLHEVREVTAGRRFVLLSFLYGDPPRSESA